MIFHITTRAAWDEAQRVGVYSAPSLDSEGFIHFSSREQVVRTANRFYAGQPDLVLLCVDVDRLEPEIRWEDPGEGEAFPHLYGPLELSAVTRVARFQPRADGELELPPELVE